MLVKGMGIVLIVISAFGLGQYFSNREEDRLQMLEHLYHGMLQLKGEICYHHEPLPDAFLLVAERSNGVVGDWFGQMADILMKEEGRFLIIWERSIEEILGSTSLTKEELQPLYYLGKQLGYLDIEMQERGITLFLEDMNQCVQAQAVSLKEKQKLYRNLSLLAACFFIIVLI